MHTLRLQTERVGDIEEIRLAGSVEAMNFAALASTLQRLLQTGHCAIVLDCRELTHFGSAELMGLLQLTQSARAGGGDIKCVGLSPQIRQVVVLLAGANGLEHHDDLLAALEAFHSRHLPVGV